MKILHRIYIYGFMVSGRTIKLKSVNYMEIYYTTAMKSSIKIHQLLMYTIWRQTVNITVKFSCHTVLCTYIHIAMYSYYIYQMSKLLCNVLLL